MVACCKAESQIVGQRQLKGANYYSGSDICWSVTTCKLVCLQHETYVHTCVLFAEACSWMLQ